MRRFSDIKRILIINLGGIGDALLSLPALKAIKNNFPKAEISILVVPRVFELTNDLTYVKEAIIFQMKPKFFLKDLKTLFVLRKRDFDLGINMRTLVSERSACKIKLMFDIIKPKIKVGRDTQARGYFFDIKIPEALSNLKYEMEYDIDTAKILGAEVKDKSIDFEIGKDNIKKVYKILEKEGISEETTVIGIHPGGMPSRRWPIEKFSKVINEIHKKIPSKFMITAGEDEIPLVDRLMKMTNAKVINTAGKLGIKELIVLIKRCNLYISNDTGPMHIAAILKTPLVAIFGPGSLARYDPRNISDRTMVLYEKVDCAPCEKLRCNDLKCLKIISPEEVIQAALRQLEMYKKKIEGQEE